LQALVAGEFPFVRPLIDADDKVSREFLRDIAKPTAVFQGLVKNPQGMAGAIRYGEYESYACNLDRCALCTNLTNCDMLESVML